MTSDELHALAVATRDAARLAERHGTSTHGYRRAAREACERMGEMTEQLAVAEERAREHDEALGARDAAVARARTATQTIVEAIGSVGPESIEDAVVRIVATLDVARDTTGRALRERDQAREAERCEHSLRLRWERRTDETRAELRDLVAALSLDDGPRAAAIQHARAVLEEWGMR